jgi:hypothetical protein|tara:strand:- start:193 stop:1233 length:1041 start_codon:yes stop_codon:yes gene_type:complete
MSHSPDYSRSNLNLRAYSIKEVLPQYYASAYPNLITFLEGYYDYMDSDGTIDALQDLYSLYDLEATNLEYIENIFASIADGANSTYFSEPREVLRNFANFYRVKGTKYSAEGFFRAFYGIDVEIEYPKNNMFIVSESQIGTESLRFIQNSALYQIFSVLIKSSVPLNTWKDLYKKFVHPAGFFLGGSVVLEMPSTNSILLTMPDNIDEPPPPLFVEGTATYTIPNGLVETLGVLPDDGDSDTVVERINLDAKVSEYKDMPADVFAASYGKIDDAMNINSPTFDDSAKDFAPFYSDGEEGPAHDQHGVRMSNDIERFDKATWFYDSAAGNPRYMTIGYVDSDYVELT